MWNSIIYGTTIVEELTLHCKIRYLEFGSNALRNDFWLCTLGLQKSSRIFERHLYNSSQISIQRTDRLEH